MLLESFGTQPSKVDVMLSAAQDDTSYSLQCSYFEIYNEVHNLTSCVDVSSIFCVECTAEDLWLRILCTLQHITDLLAPCAEKSLAVRVHPKHGPFVDGLSAEPVGSGALLAGPGMRCELLRWRIQQSYLRPIALGCAQQWQWRTLLALQWTVRVEKYFRHIRD